METSDLGEKETSYENLNAVQVRLPKSNIVIAGDICLLSNQVNHLGQMALYLEREANRVARKINTNKTKVCILISKAFISLCISLDVQR